MNALLLILFGAMEQFGEPPGARMSSMPDAASVPAEALRTRRSRPSSIPAEGSGETWRYVFHQGRWWYWSASERWSYFDGAKWRRLDSVNQPISRPRELAAIGPRQLRAEIGPKNFRFRFGELPAPRSRAGSFDASGAAPLTNRSFAGAFGVGADSTYATLSSPTEPKIRTGTPYGPGSTYGAYGSTNLLRSGQHVGAGGSYGYGLGAQRPAFGYGRTSSPRFSQPP